LPSCKDMFLATSGTVNPRSWRMTSKKELQLVEAT
jgi:hypothetical protein